jgi:hypothetical protein
LKPGDVEGLSEKAQAKVNERIHELNVKRKNAEAKATDLETEVATLKGKTGAVFEAVAKMGLAPEYVAEAEAKQIQRYEQLKVWNRWLTRNAAGYEGSDDKEDPSWTQEQVADAKLKVEEELMELAPVARGLWTSKIEQMKADLERGRKARLAEERAKAGPTAGQGRKAPAKPPKLPDGGAGSRRPPVSAGAARRSAFDEKQFQADGGGRSALEKQFEAIIGG